MATITIDTTKITKRVLESVGLTTQKDAQILANRAYEVGYSDNPNDEPPSGELKSYKYKRITAGGLRDFTKIPYDKIISTVWTLFQSNPVVKRANKIKVSYFLGGGIEYNAGDNKDVKEVLDTNWRINRMNRKLRKFVFELRLWGEQIYPTFVRQTDGQTRLGYIDPGEVGVIKTHPDNSMDRWAVVIKGTTGKRKVYRVVREDESFIDSSGQLVEAKYEGLMVTAEQTTLQDWEKAFLKECGLTQYTGSCLLFQVNNMSNQSRGFSDYLQSADWLDALDETLFAVGEREQFANFFGWDFTLEGMSEPEVEAYAKKDRKNPPKRGTAHYHNEKVTRELKYPDLKQMGSIETVKAVLTFILGGLGYPLHWFGFGNDSNRATANAQSEPTWKTLEEEQDEVKEMILDILTFFRDQAIIAGLLKPADAEAKISVTMPEMTKKDLSQLSAAMAQTASALMVAEQNGWSTKEQTVTAWQKLMQEFGVDAVTLKEINKEAPMETAESAQQWLRNRINGNG